MGDVYSLPRKLAHTTYVLPYHSAGRRRKGCISTLRQLRLRRIALRGSKGTNPHMNSVFHSFEYIAIKSIYTSPQKDQNRDPDSVYTQPAEQPSSPSPHQIVSPSNTTPHPKNQSLHRITIRYMYHPRRNTTARYNLPIVNPAGASFPMNVGIRWC